MKVRFALYADNGDLIYLADLETGNLRDAMDLIARQAKEDLEVYERAKVQQ